MRKRTVNKLLVHILLGTCLSLNFAVTFANEVDVQAKSILSLNEAIALGLKLDIGQRKQASLAEAYRQKAQSVKRLSEPTLKFGLLNYPTDTFARDQAPMTQAKFGIKQNFPKGKTLRLKSERAQINASRHLVLKTNQGLMTQQMVRKAWLELMYWLKAETIVRKNKRYLQQVLKITQDQYRSGRRPQQDVIRGQLEIDLIDDKVLSIKTKQEQARAKLGKWIGYDNAARPLPKSIPKLPTIPESFNFLELLKRHPKFISSLKMVAAKAKNVDIAKQAFKPQFSVELSYANRVNRADFASVAVGVKLPFLRKKKYDHNLLSAQSKLGAAQADNDDVYIEMRRQYHDRYATWRKLQERERKFRKVLMPRANSNARVTVSAYRNGRSDFNTLIRARVIKLNVELKALRVLVNYLKAKVDLLYLSGSTK